MASPDAGAGPVRSPVALRVLGIAFLAWSVVGLVSLSQLWVEAMSQRAPPLDWRRVGRLFQDVWAWAGYTPVILWLADRLPLDRERWGRRLPVHAAIALGFTGVDALLATLFAPLLGPSPAHGILAALARHATAAVLSYFAVLGIGHALRYQRLHAQGRLHASELERQLAQARLGVLEAQLRPHFLFNALHAVASLVRAGDQKGAIRTIAGLGEILRAALRDGDEQEIPLAEELRLAERYLEIERARFEDRLAVRIETDALGDALVPRFVLQPLLENAVRHGIAPRPAGGAITVRAARAEAALVLEVIDRGAGRAQPRVHGTGVGLANTRARLRHLYGPAASLALETEADGTTVARVVLPYRRAPVRRIA
jgi:two-component system LytT family sensor kinase